MRLRDFVIITILLALLFGAFLGSRPLSVPDEGRYVEIPREMVATGDWLTPRLNGVKYFEKPPFAYWFEAVLISLFGISEWSVRLGPALFALVGCFAVLLAGNRLFGSPAGLLAAIVLATSTLYFALARLITLDMPVSVLLTAALLSFLLGTREPEKEPRRLFFWSFYAFSGLAVMTKGLIGIVFPGMIIFLWMLVTNEWRVLKSMHLLSGMVIFLAIAAPWHIMVNKANPEFFDFYFIREHFQRYLTKVHHHYKPFWFFIPIVLGGLLPWSVFLIQSVRHSLPASWNERHRHKEAIFLLLWAGLIFLFFSASSSKLIPYILPVLPPLALLIGKYLADGWNEAAPGGFRAGLILYSVVSALLACGLFLAPRFAPAAGTPGMTIIRWAVAFCLLLGIIAAWTAPEKKPVFRAIVYITFCFSFLMIAGSAVVPAFDNRTLKPFAISLKPLLKPDDDIVHFRNYYQDLPVYLERRMTIAGWRGELDFGTTIENTSSWMIDEAELWKRWDGPRRLFLVTGRRDADELRKAQEKSFFLVAENKNTVILSNRENTR